MEEEREKSVLVDPRVVCDIESRNRPILFGGTSVKTPREMLLVPLRGRNKQLGDSRRYVFYT